MPAAPVIVSHVVVPGTVTLPLAAEPGAAEEWLLVKRRLTAGETLDLFERAAPGVDLARLATAQLSPAKVGTALLLAYVVDWNLVAPDGSPLELRHASEEDRERRFRMLTIEKYLEVVAAVSAHDRAIRQEKKRPAPGDNGSSPRLP